MKFSFDDIRAECKWVCDNAGLVALHPDKIQTLLPRFTNTGHISWQEAMPVKIHQQDFESALRFSLLLNVTSFCFWPKPKWRMLHEGQELGGAFSLATCYAHAANKDRDILVPENWLDISLADYHSLTKTVSGYRIPLAEDRLQALHDLGRLLSKEHGNSVQSFIASCDHDAETLLNTLAAKVHGYDDVHPYKGRNIPLLKRVQLSVVDLSALYRHHGQPGFTGIEGITAASDYKLPQILRHYGVISYAPSLQEKVDNEYEIASGSADEIEIRAAALHAVELIREAMQRHHGITMTSNQISDQIWLLSQEKIDGIKSHHQVLTRYY